MALDLLYAGAMSKWFCLILLVVGCASEPRLPAPYFAESAHVLPVGGVSVTGVAGGAALSDGHAAGVAGRVRVGIGGNQELGVEADAFRASAESNHCSFDCDGYPPNSTYFLEGRGAALSYKLGLRPELALVATFGAAHHWYAGGDPAPVGDFGGKSLNGSLGAIGTKRLNATSDLYIGLRLSAAAPVGARVPTSDDHAIGAFHAAIGGRFRVADQAHLYLEAGGLATSAVTLGGTAVGGVELSF